MSGHKTLNCRKKVLIVVYYWPPAGGGGVQRWVKFVKYLRDFGWEPVVYTAANADYPVTDPGLVKDIPEAVEIIRQPIIEPYTWFRKLTGKSPGEKINPAFLSEGKKFGWKEKLAVWIRGNIFIPDARCLWIKPSILFLTDYVRNNPVDVLVTSGPPHSCHLIGLGLKEKIGIPWIADFRDQWTQIDYFEDLRLTSFARKKHLELEKSVLDNCDCVLTVGPALATGLKKITDNRIEVITNGFDEADRKKQSYVKSKDRFSLVYAGTINDAQNPHVLWTALKKMKESNHPLIRNLTVMIVGTAEQNVLHTIALEGIEELVEFTGYLSHEEAIRYQEEADILLLFINRTRNNKVIVTGKIFEYLDSGKPILCIGPDDGDAASIISDVHAGITCGYEDPDAVIDAIEKLHSLKETYKVEREKILKYSRKRLTENLVSLFNQLIHNHRH